MAEAVQGIVETPIDDRLSRAKLRIGLASMVGAIIEWYDFYAYGTAAALVFRQVFFPNLSPTLGSVVAFSTFAVGFLFRPLGSIVMGHFGDRIGRKTMLIVTVLAMGISTALIGFLPGYASIGAWAPILLIVLRAIQGFAVGGEAGGAILIAVEHAPNRYRGLFSGFPQLGVSGGLVVANLVFLGANLSMSSAEFQAYGWRIPFLLSIVLVIVALYIRLRISESPVFLAAQAQGRKVAVPLIEVFRRGWSQILRVVLTLFYPNTMGYMTIIFMLTYGTTVLHISRTTMLTFTIVANCIEVPYTLYAGFLSDRFGRRNIILAGIGVGIVMGIVFFPLVNTAIPAIVFAAILIVRLSIATMYGPLGAMCAEQFDTTVRYTGIGVSFGISALIGSQTPAIAAYIASGGGTFWLSVFLVGAAVIAFISTAFLRETRNIRLTDRILE